MPDAPASHAVSMPWLPACIFRPSLMGRCATVARPGAIRRRPDAGLAQARGRLGAGRRSNSIAQASGPKRVDRKHYLLLSRCSQHNSRQHSEFCLWRTCLSCEIRPIAGPSQARCSLVAGKTRAGPAQAQCTGPARRPGAGRTGAAGPVYIDSWLRPGTYIADAGPVHTWRTPSASTIEVQSRA